MWTNRFNPLFLNFLSLLTASLHYALCEAPGAPGACAPALHHARIQCPATESQVPEADRAGRALKALKFIVDTAKRGTQVQEIKRSSIDKRDGTGPHYGGIFA